MHANEPVPDLPSDEETAKAIDVFYRQISYVNSGGKYSREEMNER